MLIRCVSRNDESQWLQMRRKLWPDQAEQEHIDQVNGFFNAADSTYAVFVAECEAGHIVGFCEVGIYNPRQHDEARLARIEGLFLEPAVQSPSLADMLLSAAEAWCCSHQCDFCIAESDSESALVDVYQTRGYNIHSRIVRFVKLLYPDR